MKLDSIRARFINAFAGLALALASTTANVTYAANQLAWDKTFPQSEKVTHQKVSFNNRLGLNLVADLYFPKDLDQSIKHPAIVVGGPYGTVKEQSAGLYAQTMAELGFVTLTPIHPTTARVAASRISRLPSRRLSRTSAPL